MAALTDLYMGLMSGTSADGIDAALLDMADGSPTLVHSVSLTYPPDLRRRIVEMASATTTRLEDLGQLDHVLGQAFADAAIQLIAEAGIAADDVRAIGCHGQTVRHRPALESPFSLQIGDPNLIAARTGITTVADFRRRDMALGGQGAPLVPAFHKAAFGSTSANRVVVNIGGIANLTVLASDGTVSGFDTGPGNVLLDQNIAACRGEAFDRDGGWAASGRASESLLSQMLSDPYFIASPPKSTGPEYFNLRWLTAHRKQCKTDAEGADLQATLAELTARSIAAAIDDQAQRFERVLLCGGGTHNADLVARLAWCLPDTPIDDTTCAGIDPDFVEAAAFAWLAYQTTHGLPGNVPAVTGASAPSVIGAIYPVAKAQL